MTPYAAWFVGKLKKDKYGPIKAFAFENYMKALYARIADQVWNKGFDALLCSTLITSIVPADHDHSTTPFMLEGEKMPTLFIGALTLPWNVLNWCPVVSVPAGIGPQNMPVGLQIVGRPYHDQTVLRTAYAHEGSMAPLYAGKLLPDFRSG